jgi:type I restriction-modification system DNA methylase subunit
MLVFGSVNIFSQFVCCFKLSTIGQTLDEAMEVVEKENKELKNVLPQVYGKANLDKTSLGELIDLNFSLITNIPPLPLAGS